MREHCSCALVAATSPSPTIPFTLAVAEVVPIFAAGQLVRFERSRETVVKIVDVEIALFCGGGLHHAPGLGFAVGDQFGILATEGLRYVAIPTYGAVGGKYFGKLLRAYVFPLNRRVVRAEQRGGVIEVLEFAESFFTVDALLALIPLRDDIPDETVFGIHFELLQAFLTAVLALRPARALLQAQGRLREKRAERDLACGYVDGGRLLSLWASDQALAAVSEVGPHAGNGAEHEQAHGEGQQDSGDQDCRRHKSPPASHLV